MNQNWNDDKCRCDCETPEKHCVCKKYIYSLDPAKCSCKNGIYSASIIDDSVIMCDEIIDAVVKLYDETTKTVPTKILQKVFIFY